MTDQLFVPGLTSVEAQRIQDQLCQQRKRLIRTPKLYWNDVGLALHMGGGSPTGARLENYVLTDLLAWRDTETPRPEVLCWRTAAARDGRSLQIGLRRQPVY